MDPENTTTDTAAQAAATTEQPASPPATEKPSGSFTQEDVNRIVAKRLEEDRARRPAAAPAPKPAAPSTAKASAEPDVRAELEEMRRETTELKQRLDYSSRATRLGLDEARAAALFPVYQANPDGFDNVVTALGIKAHQPAVNPAPTATQAEAPKPPAAAPSAPTATSLPTQNGIVDLFALSPVQLRQLGPDGVRENLERLWKIGNQLSGAPTRPKVPSQR